MSFIIHVGEIIALNDIGFGTILEAEPMHRTSVNFVGKTFVFDLDKIAIGFDIVKHVNELKKYGIGVGSIVRFTTDEKGRVTRVYPLVFRTDIKIVK